MQLPNDLAAQLTRVLADAEQAIQFQAAEDFGAAHRAMTRVRSELAGIGGRTYQAAGPAPVTASSSDALRAQADELYRQAAEMDGAPGTQPPGVVTGHRGELPAQDRTTAGTEAATFDGGQDGSRAAAESAAQRTTNPTHTEGYGAGPVLAVLPGDGSPTTGTGPSGACQSCGASLPGGSAYCPSCGRAQATPGGPVTAATAPQAGDTAEPKPATAYAPTTGAAAGADTPATDSAKSKAEAHGVDLANVDGSGKDGKVTGPDVDRHIADGGAADTDPDGPGGDPWPEGDEGRSASGDVTHSDGSVTHADGWTTYADGSYRDPGGKLYGADGKPQAAKGEPNL